MKGRKIRNPSPHSALARSGDFVADQALRARFPARAKSEIRNFLTSRPIRVLIAKPGLDGHDRGAKVVAKALMEAGMEVIYTGIRQTPEMIARTALQEDVDVVGLSLLSGAHRELFPKVIKLLRRFGSRALVFAGGIVPQGDISFLRRQGVVRVFGPGTMLAQIVDFLEKRFSKRS